MMNSKQCFTLGNEGGEWSGEEDRGKLSCVSNISIL